MSICGSRLIVLCVPSDQFVCSSRVTKVIKEQLARKANREYAMYKYVKAVPSFSLGADKTLPESG